MNCSMLKMQRLNLLMLLHRWQMMRKLGKERRQHSLPDHSYFSLEATLGRAGIQATLAADKLDIPSVGTLNQAKIIIDTIAQPKKMVLQGSMAFTIANVGGLQVTIDSEISPEGIVFSGTVPQEFSYAGMTLKEFGLSFDTGHKSVQLVGNLFLPIASDLSVEAHLLLMPDPKNPNQKIIDFRTRSSSQEFKPFNGIPGLETFYVKDFDAGLEVTQAEGKTTKTFYLNGDFYVMGVPLKSIVKFVDEPKGVYINAPMTKDKSLTDIFPALAANDPGGVFKNLVFAEAMFIASTIDYVDINPETKAQTQIKKGLNFLASVPLKGTLEPVGKLLGSNSSDFYHVWHYVSLDIRLSKPIPAI